MKKFVLTAILAAVGAPALVSAQPTNVAEDPAGAETEFDIAITISGGDRLPRD